MAFFFFFPPFFARSYVGLRKFPRRYGRREIPRRSPARSRLTVRRGQKEAARSLRTGSPAAALPPAAAAAAPPPASRGPSRSPERLPEGKEPRAHGATGRARPARGSRRPSQRGRVRGASGEPAAALPAAVSGVAESSGSRSAGQEGSEGGESVPARRCSPCPGGESEEDEE